MLINYESVVNIVVVDALKSLLNTQPAKAIIVFKTTNDKVAITNAIKLLKMQKYDITTELTVIDYDSYKTQQHNLSYDTLILE